MSFLARGISNLIGIVAPVVHSFKVLKKPTRPRLIECLHYWTVYGTFLITDWFLNTFFISCFIPFYDFFVLCFTVLLALPHLGFASAIYTKFLAPFLRKYERRIDNVTAAVMAQIWEKVPSVAMTAPAVLFSIVNALNAPMVPAASIEIEEMDDSSVEFITERRRSAARSVSRSSMRSSRVIQRIQPAPVVLDQSFEIQEESDLTSDENNDGDNNVFQNVPDRDVKREITDEDDDFDVDQKDVLRALPTRRTAPMRATRRNLRSSSVQ